MENRIAVYNVATFVVNRKRICIARTPKGFYAMQDKCPHQGASLGKGHCTDDALVCPWHRWHFNLETGRGGGDAAITYPIELRNDGVYIGITRTVFSLFK